MPSIEKLDFVQVCRLSLNVYNNTLRKFYKFSDSRQSWTSPTLESAGDEDKNAFYCKVGLCTSLQTVAECL